MSSESRCDRIDSLTDQLDSWLDELELLAASRPEASFDELLSSLIESAQARSEPLPPSLVPQLRQQFQSLRAIDGLFRQSQAANVQLPQIEGFEVYELIGHGGMGVVYRARQLSLGRDVALKIMLGGRFATERSRQRFLREAQMAARLAHPNIVQIFESSECDGLPYLAQELLCGGTLAERMATGPQPPKVCAELVEILAGAVYYAHQNGIIHRDLKPSNVLLASDGRPKIVDFGLAKALDEGGAGLTRTGEAAGTPAYMAPEQISGGAVGPAVDIYALGAILYELLTGKLPFEGGSSVHVFSRIIADPPKSPWVVTTGVPADLGAIALRCLEKKPSARYASAAELARDLRRFLDGEPTVARPLAPAVRIARWARRRPIAAALVAVLLASTAAIVGGSLWYSAQLQTALASLEAEKHKTEHERDEADRAREAAERHLYASEIRVARQALRQSNFEELRRVLEEYSDGKRWAHLRGFEWHYLAQFCKSPGRFATAHECEVYCTAFSPDGTLLASGGKNGLIFLWDRKTGRPLGYLEGHTDCVNDLAFHPTDGRLLSASCDETIRIWDVSTRQCLETHQQPGPAFTLAISPDGTRIAIGSNYARALIWNLVDRKTELELPLPADASLPKPIEGTSTRTLAWSRDGRFIALACGREFPLCVWDLKAGTGALSLGMTAFDIAITPDSSRLIVVGEDQQLGPAFRVYDLINDEWGTPPNPIGSRHIQSVAVSPDGDRFATAGDDAIVRVWRIGLTRPIHSWHGHQGPIRKLAFSPDGQLLASASMDETVGLWDRVVSVDDPVSSVPLSRTTVGIAFDIDGQRLAAHAADGQLLVFDACSGEQLASGQANARGHLSFTGDHAHLLAQNGAEPTIDIRDARTLSGESISLSNRTSPVSLSEDGRRAAACCGSQAVVWNLPDQSPAASFAIEQEPGTSSAGAALSPSGQRLVVLGGYSWEKVLLIDIASRRASWSASIDGEAGAYAFSRDEKLFAVVSNDVVELIETSTGNLLRELSHDLRVSSLAFSADDRTLATASHDGVSLWHVESGQLMFAFRHADRLVDKVGFSRDGRRLGYIARSPDGSEVEVYIRSTGDVP